MSTKRLGWIAASTALALSAVGTTSASAARPTFSPPPPGPVHFQLAKVRETGVGFTLSSNPNAPLPALRVGSNFTLTAVVVAPGAGVGTPGVQIGRVLIECVVITAAPDGICTGIFHLPNGFLSVSGNGPFTKSKVKRWAVTGGVGVGQYADARGDITVTPTSNGAVAAVALGTR